MTNESTKKYSVDVYNDGSDVEIMTENQLRQFAQEQACELYDEVILNITDEKGNVIKEYAEGYKLLNKIVNDNYLLQTIHEVEVLFTLPAITIPFTVTQQHECQVEYKNIFIRYDYEDEAEPIAVYNGELDLYNETTQFYHDTFADEEGYDENREYTNVLDCVDLWEGNGYGIAQVIKGRY